MTGLKMITCCYCGARDVMRMGKGQRVSLSCLTCGAPVKKVETVKVKDAIAAAPATPPEKVNKHRRPAHFEAAKKRKKKRKSLLAGILDEAEDFFDLDDWFDWD